MSNKFSKNKKLVAIVGTTASGKTGLGVYLAHKFNGEIISADSRQVYRGMDIGTGKDLKEYWIKIIKTDVSVKTGSSRRFAPQDDRVLIPYHLIDVVGSKTEFNLAKFQKLAYKAIEDIWSREKLPIIVGGTGLYAQAVVDGFNLPSGKPDKKLRAKLEKKTVEQLFNQLKRLDCGKAKDLNESDKKNKRRLIRYIEVSRMATDKIANSHEFNTNGHGYIHEWPRIDTLIIGVTHPKEVLHERIYKRLIERLEKEDMISEVERLRKQGVSWKRLIDFGLEYKYIALYLKGELDYEEMVERLYRAIKRFAKRQLTWLRRWESQEAKINWVKNKREADKLLKNFIKK